MRKGRISPAGYHGATEDIVLKPQVVIGSASSRHAGSTAWSCETSRYFEEGAKLCARLGEPEPR